MGQNWLKLNVFLINYIGLEFVTVGRLKFGDWTYYFLNYIYLGGTMVAQWVGMQQ